MLLPALVSVHVVAQRWFRQAADQAWHGSASGDGSGDISGSASGDGIVDASGSSTAVCTLCK